MIREKRRHRVRKKRILLIFLVILLILAAAVLVVTQVFTVKKVEVSGNELYPDEQIEESVLNDEYSWNSLYVFFKYKLFHVQEMPFIDEMEIKLLSPHIIRINVYEKAIIGYLESNNQNIYFDKEGFVVEISKKLIENIPRIEGIECHTVVVYEKLNIDNEADLSLILTFSQQLQKYSLVPDTISIGKNGNLSAAFGDISVVVGESDYLVEKVMRLYHILPELTHKKGTLHLENWTPLTTDIIFSPE